MACKAAEQGFGEAQTRLNDVLAKARAQEEQRARKQEMARAKAASQEAFESFTKKAGVKDWVDAEKLQANPFIYEGQVVLVWVNFETMLSRDQGLFGGPTMISGIPRGRFTGGESVLLAGRVLGEDYVKLPVAGEVLVPHLRYVDAHVCQSRSCGEMLRWRE